MSKILVRKALELVQNDLKSESGRVKEKSHSSSSVRHKVQKHKKAPQVYFERSTSRTLTLDNKVQHVIDQYKKDHLVDRTEENLEILHQLRNLKPKLSTSQKILDFYTKKQEISEEQPEPESVLFPEEPKKKKRKHK